MRFGRRIFINMMPRNAFAAKTGTLFFDPLSLDAVDLIFNISKVISRPCKKKKSWSPKECVGVEDFFVFVNLDN